MATEHVALSESEQITACCDDTEKIPVYLINGKPKVWNAKDAVTLRESYRIVGVLVGCLPRNPRQNVHPGLPLQLMPEELSLLLNKGYVKLLKEKPVTSEQCSQRAQVVEQERKANFEVQQQLYREDRRQEMLRQMTHILEGKKAKRQRLLEASGKDPATEEATTEGEELCLDEIPVTPTPEKHMLQQLFTENPWRRETESAGDDWKFPTTDSEKVRCAVFQDLWEKQYYLTSGQKFGGDFLAYPGDPSRFHSFYIVICVDHSQQMPALDIISMGRLGSNVMKTLDLSPIASVEAIKAGYSSSDHFTAVHYIMERACIDVGGVGGNLRWAS